jgi:hypothetical protein
MKWKRQAINGSKADDRRGPRQTPREPRRGSHLLWSGTVVDAEHQNTAAPQETTTLTPLEKSILAAIGQGLNDTAAVARQIGHPNQVVRAVRSLYAKGRLPLASIAVGGVPLMYPRGHPLAGQIIEFPVTVPGCYFLEFRVAPYFMRFHLDIDEDGRARLRLVEKSLPDDCGLTGLERELLDGLAQIIARDILRQRVVK